MKKIFASILMLLYISASGGVVLNVHYCMGEISSVELDHSTDSEDCDKCGMPESGNSCCRSEFKVVKFDNLHKASEVVYGIQLPVSDIPSNVSLIDISKLVSYKAEQPVAYVPSDDYPPDLNILNCIFRI